MRLPLHICVLILSLASCSTCVLTPSTLANSSSYVADSFGHLLGGSFAQDEATKQMGMRSRLWGMCEDLTIHTCQGSTEEDNLPCICDFDVWKIVAGFAILFVFFGALILITFMWLSKPPSAEMQSSSMPKHVGDMTRRLADVKMQGSTMRLKVSGPPALIGLAMIGFGLPTTYLYMGHFIFLFSIRVIVAGFTILVSVLLPTDTMAISAVSGVVIVLLLGNAYNIGILSFHTQTNRSDLKAKGYSEFAINYLVGHWILDCVIEAGLGLYVLSHACRSPFRTVLRNLWLAAGVFSLWCFCLTLGTAARKLCGAHQPWPWYSILFSLGMTFLNAVTCLHPAVRHHIRHWLLSYSGVSAAAAGVAELISHMDPAEAMTKAEATFFCVSADCLTREDMADNKPNPRLRVHAKRAELGSVDAFMSHSWHDNAEEKWTTLQAWRADFKLQHAGKEPTLWIDKYCIDQNSIDDSLACLPIYLAGCKNLFVLCGETYLERLWCVVELFVFMEMNLDIALFEVRMLNNRQDVQQDVRNFDVQRARCFTEADTHRLMDVIDAGGPGLTKQLVEFVKQNFKMQKHEQCEQDEEQQEDEADEAMLSDAKSVMSALSLVDHCEALQDEHGEQLGSRKDIDNDKDEIF